MLNKRHEAAQKIAHQLDRTEQALTASMRNTAQLTLAIIEARDEAGVPINLGADALSHNAEVGVALATAWTKIVAVHQALRKDQDDAGLEAFAYGDNDTCVKTFAPSGSAAAPHIAAA